MKGHTDANFWEFVSIAKSILVKIISYVIINLNSALLGCKPTDNQFSQYHKKIPAKNLSTSTWPDPIQECTLVLEWTVVRLNCNILLMSVYSSLVSRWVVRCQWRKSIACWSSFYRVVMYYGRLQGHRSQPFLWYGLFQVWYTRAYVC